MKTQNSIENEEVEYIEQPYQKISVKEGDVIVLSCDRCLSGGALNRLYSDAKQVFPNNIIWIIEDGIKIGVMEQKE